MACLSRIKTTKEYFIATRWNGINTRTVNGKNPNWKSNLCRYYLDKGIRLEMTREEFGGWVISNWHYAVEIFNKGLTPSLDRIDEDGPYSLDNIQIISRNDNSSKRGPCGYFLDTYTHARSIKMTHIESGKQVIDVRRNLLKRFPLILGSGIDRCLAGYCKTYKGYIFEYSNKNEKNFYNHKRVGPKKYDHEKVISLAKKGMHFKDIAKEIGCHPSYASCIIRNASN